MHIVPVNKLIELKKNGYKYSGEDESLTNIIFSTVTKFVAPFVPSCISPNLITIIGFIFTIVAYICALCGSTAYFFISVMTFMLLDSLDGAHARNIGKSSAIGELLDHTLDSLSNTLITMSLCTLADIPTATSFWIVQCMNIVFYVSHISTYYNGMLRIGRFGPAEAVMLVTTLIVVQDNYGLNISAYLSYKAVLAVYYIIASVFTIMTTMPKTLQVESHIENDIIKDMNVGNLLIVSLPMLAVPYYMKEMTHFTVFTYSQSYHLLTLETILSKILHKNFNINTLLLAVILLMCVDLPIMASFTFIFYYICVITAFQEQLPSPMIFIKQKN